jgi:acyl phosphate:glycerol-3-phosphate acyltransferase
VIYGKEILIILLSYMTGCVSTGYYLTLFSTGKDIRAYGSTSTGATNVGRILGKTGFIATFLIDMAKGMLAVWAGTILQIHPLAIIISMLAVLVGHIWPIQLDFRGGKGIAVVIGVLLIFDYWLIVWAAMVFCAGLIFFKKHTVSIFVAIIILPLITVLTGHSVIDILGITVIATIILFAHRQNIFEYVKKIKLEGKKQRLQV